MDFGRRLRQLRKRDGFRSQDDLAKALEIPRSTIAMYESGQRMPSRENIEMLADFFNVDTDYLLGRTNYTTRIAHEPLDNPDRAFLMDRITRASDEDIEQMAQLWRMIKKEADYSE